MLIFILIAFLIAKIKKYNVSKIFMVTDLYPLFFVEAVYIVLQMMTLSGNYSFLKYASLLQIAFIASLLPVIIRRKLNIQAIAGALSIVLGTVLNKIVITANSGKMPVLPTLSKLTGYYKDGILEVGADSLHVPFTASTKLPFLADYIDTGYSIMSIGDLFIHSFVTIIVLSAIIQINRETSR